MKSCNLSSPELPPSGPAPILIMDSGVGGLSVAGEIRKTCPGHPLIYLADNGAFPYGDKAEDWLVKRVVALAQQLVSRYPIRLLVLGCNTASTVVLPALRAALNIPVVGVVPAIKPAAALSRSGHFALLATPGTVNRSYTDQLIRDYAAGCQVSRLGSTDVVRLAEDKLAGKAVDLQQLSRIMQPLFQQPTLDTVVLGCTHFPLLKPELEQIQPRPIQWVDSGAAIARRVAGLLAEEAGQAENRPGDNIAFVTRPAQSDSLIQTFKNLGFDRLELLQ